MERVVKWSKGPETESSLSTHLLKQQERMNDDLLRFRDMSKEDQRRVWISREAALASAGDYHQRLKRYAAEHGDARHDLFSKREKLDILAQPWEKRREIHSRSLEDAINVQQELFKLARDRRNLDDYNQDKMTQMMILTHSIRFLDRALDYRGKPEDFKDFGPSLLEGNEGEAEAEAEAEPEPESETEGKPEAAKALPEGTPPVLSAEAQAALVAAAAVAPQPEQPVAGAAAVAVAVTPADFPSEDGAAAAAAAAAAIAAAAAAAAAPAPTPEVAAGAVAAISPAPAPAPAAIQAEAPAPAPAPA